jgi:rod shape-determining protein MreC
LNYFSFDPKKIALVLFTIAIPLMSLNMMQDPKESPWYLKPFTMLAGYTEMGYSTFSSGVRNTVSLYLDLINIKKENNRLRHEVSQLHTRLSHIEELKLENERLNGLLGFKTPSAMELVAARVISHDLFEGDHSTIRINRGQADGVAIGQAVMTPEGVVGSILDAQRHFSKVLVLTDRYAVVDARVQRTRARGIVEGKSLENCTLQLKYLERGDDVKAGDLVVTSGLDEIFPKGFPIGEVIKVEKKPYGITQNVEVEPIIDPFRLEEVFVVTKVNLEKPEENGSPEEDPL